MAEYQSGTVETVAQDIGLTPPDVVKRWILEIDGQRNDQRVKDWLENGARVVDLYRGGRRKNAQGRRVRWNVLYSNTELLKSALYQRTPEPDVRRRFKDKDPVGRIAAEMLQRAIAISVDNFAFDDVMRESIADYLLPGRGIARVRYVPHFESRRDRTEVRRMDDGTLQDLQGNAIEGEAEEDEETGSVYIEGEAYDWLAYEEVVCEHVNWRDLVVGPARSWVDVPWIAFRLSMTREELIENYGREIGEAVPLDDNLLSEDKRDSKDLSDGLKTIFRRAVVWEIWDRRSRTVVSIAESFKERPLDVRKDPLNLEQFFPVPQPLVSMTDPDSMVPSPEFGIYEDQAMELDRLTARIDKLTSALKVRGLYDKNLAAVADVLTAADNTLVGIDNWEKFKASGGGIDQAIWFFPFDAVVGALQSCYAAREQSKATIYEITGISDIVRGASQPTETATAQRIKGNYASLRLRNRQAAVGRYARDLFRLMGEVMAEHFQPETFLQLTGLKVPTRAERDIARQLMASTQQGAPLPPDVNPDQVREAAMADATLEDVMELIRRDVPRNFRLDIETDSTVEPDATEEQQNRVQFVQAVTQFLAAVAPLVQAGALPPDVARELLMFAVRAFKVGTTLEEALDQIGRAPAPQQPDPKVEQAKAMMQLKAQESQQSLALEQAKAQADVETDRARLAADVQMQREKAAQDMALEQQRAEADMALKAQSARNDAAMKQADQTIKMLEAWAKTAAKPMVAA